MMGIILIIITSLFVGSAIAHYNGIYDGTNDGIKEFYTEKIDKEFHESMAKILNRR